MSPSVAALVGGALIGLGASALLLALGKVAGISGIVGGLLVPGVRDVAYRFWFIGGLLAAGAVLVFFFPALLPRGDDEHRPLWLVSLAGLLVGYGTRLGGGCTSGHGVCGIARLSPRSLVATIVFIAVGMMAASVARSVLS